MVCGSQSCDVLVVRLTATSASARITGRNCGPCAFMKTHFRSGGATRQRSSYCRGVTYTRDGGNDERRLQSFSLRSAAKLFRCPPAAGACLARSRWNAQSTIASRGFRVAVVDLLGRILLGDAGRLQDRKRRSRRAHHRRKPSCPLWAKIGHLHPHRFPQKRRATASSALALPTHSRAHLERLASAAVDFTLTYAGQGL